MLNFIKQMLSGKDNTISTTRVVTIFTAFTILGIYIAQNALAMLKCGGYMDFPANTVMALLVVMGAKVGQSFTEGRKSGSEPESPTPADPSVDQPVPPKE